MADPGEGVAADGTIRTGAQRDRVPALFEPVLADAITFLGRSRASLYVYGSVADGTARPGSSDVDLLSIDLPLAGLLGQQLSARYSDRCRGVEVAAARAVAGAAGIRDGGRGPARCPDSPQDATGRCRAGQRARPHRTTSRLRAAQRWSEVDTGLSAHLGLLLSWAERERHPAPGDIQLALASDGIVSAVVRRFATLIGLWEDEGPESP